MPTITFLQGNAKSECLPHDVVGRSISELIPCIEDALQKKNYGLINDLIRLLLARRERKSLTLLTFIIGYIASRDLKTLMKIVSNVINESTLPLNNLIKAISVIVGLDKLIVIGSKYGIVNRKFIDLIIDELTCRELTTLTNILAIISIDKESLVKVISRSLGTAYCRQAKQAALELIVKALKAGKLGLTDIIAILQRHNMKLLIVKDRKGNIREVKLIHKNVEELPVIPGLESLTNALSTA